MSKIADRIKEIADKLEKTQKENAALEKVKGSITATSSVASFVKKAQSAPKT